MFTKIRNSIGLIYLVTLLWCAESTSANDSTKMRDVGIRSEEPHGEQLLARAPDGWQQGFATTTPVLRMVEFFPDDDSMKDWTEKVTFESLSGHPLPDPIEFVTGIGADQSASCERFEHLNIRSGLENNYPTSVRLLTCNHNKLTQRAQVTLIKAIQANDHFYVITRSKRVPPVSQGTQPISEAEIATWATYMRGITVCDSERNEHPCPARE